MRPVVVGLAVLALAGCGGVSDDERKEVERLAQDAYARANAEGVDFSRGPCLGIIKEGWVADVAHDPREDVDDEPENQCEQYRAGEADHFVELTPEGEVIRVE